MNEVAKAVKFFGVCLVVSTLLISASLAYSASMERYVKIEFGWTVDKMTGKSYHYNSEKEAFETFDPVNGTLTTSKK